MKAADQILPTHEIDACFTSDCGIHLRQKRCWNLQYWNAAHKNSRKESGYIGDDSSAKADHYAGAVGPLRYHLLCQRFHGSKALVHFSAGEEQDLVAEGPNAGCKPGSM